MSGLIDSTLEEIDTSLREIRRQLSTLEAFRRQLVGDDNALSGRVTAPRERPSGAVS